MKVVVFILYLFNRYDNLIFGDITVLFVEVTCKQEGEICARDEMLKVDCCEAGLNCNIRPDGWGICTKIGTKSTFYIFCYKDR